ncbi:unnamed protein product [Orchesella dallaii]|uniref:Uncharacterized protein n=1 Tax=Orchesella dallaii TaxID=48710 RepID=A0ABP1PT94_9HEXA
MYRDIGERARTPAPAEEMYAWLRRGIKPSVFVSRAKDTPKFLNETIIPLEEDCSRNPPEDLLEKCPLNRNLTGIYSKYLDAEMTDSDFFVRVSQEITRTSPAGEIKLHPFIRRLKWSRSDSIGVYIRWFIQIQKAINLKNQSAYNDREIEWTGYQLSVDL